MENISNNGECEGSFVLSDEILPLNIGMEFESEDEAYIYYNKYARMIGFSIRKEYVNKNKTHGYVTSRKLTCYKEGERGYDKRTVKKSRKETRTGCSAHITISRQSNKKYQIISFEPTHNHPLVAKSCTHLLPSQRSIQGAQAFEINLADDSGINSKSAFDYASLQAGGRSNLGYTLTDHKNFLRSKRKFDLKNGEAASLLQYFERRRMLDPMFQSAIDLDEDDMITNIFWADSQMILDYNNYGDVLSFDTTFRTNKDYRPLALFLGMNNHRQILIFGAALLYDETKKSFEWLFRTFLHVMSEQVPDTFITDQDAAIMNAVEKVMPATSHRLCIWHLGKNAFKNLNHLFTSKDSFPSDFGKLLHHYEYEDDFLHAWKDMLDKYELHDNSWLQTTFALREKWSKAYRKSRFSAGIRSTQLSESFNGSLRIYLKSDLDLSQFFKHFERAINDKRHKELDAIYDMTQKLSIMKVDYPLLRHARHVYTSPIFDMFQKEWIKSLLVVVNSWKEDESTFIYAVKTCGSTREHVVTSKPSELHVSCSCELFSYLGILCSHSLKILDLMNVKLIIPDQYILKRWTKDATSVCKILTFKTNVEEDPTLKVTGRFRHLCTTFVRIANEASECDEGVELSERYANELIVKLRSLKAKRYGTVYSQADFVHETQNLNAREIIGDAIICSKAKGIKKRESTYRGKKRLKSFTEQLSNKKTFMKKKQIYTCLDQQPTIAICPPICLDNISQFEHESTCTPSSSQPSQDVNASDGESCNIDWDTDDEREIENLLPLSSSSFSVPNGNVCAGSGEGCSSAGCAKFRLIYDMKFPEELVLKAIEQTGEEDHFESILETVLLLQGQQNSPQQQHCVNSGQCSSGYDVGFLDDLSDSDSWCGSDMADVTNSSSLEDKRLLALINMDYSAAEASIAIDRCGPEASIAELTDFITAAQMAKADDVLFLHDENKPKHSDRKRKLYELEVLKKKKHGTCLAEDNDTIRIPKPMVGFGVPTEEGSLVVHRNLPEAAIGSPFFYYENVALTPKGVWDTISRCLYDVQPEFVDSKFFSAAARKRGYVHNLPIDKRFLLLPLPPRTIQDALPLTRRWWPTWDTRTKLNCLQTCIGSAKLTERIRKALENYENDPPQSVQKYVIDQCKKWNLVWVGRNKVAPLECDEVEMLLGFPKNHTRGGGISRTDRYKSLGNSFQVDTVAYHLSVLRDLFPGGINLLSLFSGIGGAEVALHRLGIPLKNVVSVEISEVNRNIVRSWWEQTNQKGKLIHIADVQKLNGDKLEQFIASFGGFDLVVGGSPCNNLAGSNRHHRDGLEGEQSSLFYDYCRILDLVKNIMRRQ